MKIKNVMGAKLTLDSGETVTLERLGKGMFHTCYLDPSTQQVYSISIERDEGSDYSKEILANCEGSHIPDVEALGELGDRRVYRMPLYQPIRAKRHPEAWRLLKVLIEARDKAWSEIIDEQVMPRKMQQRDIGYIVNDRTIKILEDSGDVPRTLTEALWQLRDAAANYGSSYVFEFSKRNVMVDGTDTLILLDPLFSLEVVGVIRNRQAKKARGY